jgi:hypothetical protein
MAPRATKKRPAEGNQDELFNAAAFIDAAAGKADLDILLENIENEGISIRVVSKIVFCPCYFIRINSLFLSLCQSENSVFSLS